MISFQDILIIAVSKTVAWNKILTKERGITRNSTFPIKSHDKEVVETGNQMGVFSINVDTTRKVVCLSVYLSVKRNMVTTWFKQKHFYNLSKEEIGSHFYKF